MALIGSRKTALALVELYYSFLDLGEWFDGNDEWELLGCGSYRYAYLHKSSDVVYKIESDEWAESDGFGNAKEHQNASNLRKLALRLVYIPKTSLFNTSRGPIIAMEHIRGEIGNGSYAAREELYKKGRFKDMHAANFIGMPSGKIAPIDMASPRPRQGHDPFGWNFPDRRVLG